jgi:hypothetical protein
MTSPTAQLSKEGQAIAKATLAELGLTFLSPHLSAIATQQSYPEIAEQLTQMQGTDINNWVEFAPSLSNAQVIRWLSGKPVSVPTHQAFSGAVATLRDEEFSPEKMVAPDPEPYFGKLYRANQKRLVAVANGENFTHNLLTKEWATGSTLPVELSDIFLKPSCDHPVIFTVLATIRSTDHQIGVIVATPTGVSPVVDTRLYLWTGREAKNGKKVVRSLVIKGDIDLHLKALLLELSPLAV